MKSREEFIKWLDTEAGKNHIKEYAAKLEKEEKKQKELVNTDNYIKWLEKFTEEHPSFDDNEWLYFPEKISEEDNKNVDKLCKFYRQIDKFAVANYISATPCDHGEYYSIKYNDKVYEIGLVVGQGAIAFCNTNDINKEAMIIHFGEIANPIDETRIRTAKIESKLRQIDDLFKTLYMSDLQIPIDAMINRINKVLEELKKEKKQ